MAGLFSKLWAFYVIGLISFGIWYFYQPLNQEPPKSVRIVGLIESCFGVLFILISLPIRFYEMSDVMLKIPLHIIWSWVAYYGNPVI